MRTSSSSAAWSWPAPRPGTSKAGARSEVSLLATETEEEALDEDDACATYLEALLTGGPADPERAAAQVRTAATIDRMLVQKLGADFPATDIDLAVAVDRFDFAMAVERTSVGAGSEPSRRSSRVASPPARRTPPRVPDRPPAGSLPARNLLEVAAADLLAEPGCPVCLAGERAAQAFISSMLWESVTDVGFRRRLDESRGFCRRHTHAVLAAERKGRGGTLGSSILFEAILAVRLADARTAHEARGRTRARRVADAARPPACPVCAASGGAEARIMGTALGRVRDPEWQEALATTAFCLDHLVALMAAAHADESWRLIEARQLERLGAVRERLESFAHRSAHDRRHLITDEERRAADDAAELLGGRSEP